MNIKAADNMQFSLEKHHMPKTKKDFACTKVAAKEDLKCKRAGFR